MCCVEVGKGLCVVLMLSAEHDWSSVVRGIPLCTIPSYRCLEEIIAEQVNKLNITLKDIETLNTFARSRECQLTKLVQKDLQTPATSTVEGMQTEPVLDTLTVSSTNTVVEATREKLTRELQEIERER